MEQRNGYERNYLPRGGGAKGGFTAQALGHPIFTQADTWDQLKEMVQDAVRCHFAENEQPKVIRLHAVREEVMSL